MISPGEASTSADRAPRTGSGCLGVVLGLLVLLVLFVWLRNPADVASSSGPKTSATGSSINAQPQSVAFKLGALQSGRTTDVPQSLISSFDRLLDDLEGKCKEPRLLLGDMAAKGQQILKENGRSMSLPEILTAMNQSIPSGSGVKIGCADVITLVLMSMIRSR